MAEIKHRVGIKGSSAQFYLLQTTDTGLASWWTSDTRGAGNPYPEDVSIDFDE